MLESGGQEMIGWWLCRRSQLANLLIWIGPGLVLATTPEFRIFGSNRINLKSPE
jgi:hypothetical protein